MYVFLFYMFEYFEYIKMMFKIKCKLKLDDILYYDNKLDIGKINGGNKRKCYKFYNFI